MKIIKITTIITTICHIVGVWCLTTVTDSINVDVDVE